MNFEHWTFQYNIHIIIIQHSIYVCINFPFSLYSLSFDFRFSGEKPLRLGSSYSGEWFIVFSKIRFDCISSGCSLVRIQMYCIECWRYNHIKGSFNKSRYIHLEWCHQNVRHSFYRLKYPENTEHSYSTSVGTFFFYFHSLFLLVFCKAWNISSVRYIQFHAHDDGTHVPWNWLLFFSGPNTHCSITFVLLCWGLW